MGNKNGRTVVQHPNIFDTERRCGSRGDWCGLIVELFTTHGIEVDTRVGAVAAYSQRQREPREPPQHRCGRDQWLVENEPVEQR